MGCLDLLVVAVRTGQANWTRTWGKLRRTLIWITLHVYLLWIQAQQFISVHVKCYYITCSDEMEWILNGRYHVFIALLKTERCSHVFQEYFVLEFVELSSETRDFVDCIVQKKYTMKTVICLNSKELNEKFTIIIE